MFFYNTPLNCYFVVFEITRYAQEQLRKSTEGVLKKGWVFFAPTLSYLLFGIY